MDSNDPVAQWNGAVLTLRDKERDKTAAKKKTNGEPDLADASNTDAFVEFERVQKSYDGETLVVKDLNLTLPKGEFLTMLGPSGSGKTTCLMMLAGFETATHGDIRLDGVSINNIPPHKRGIGMVFQNYALFPHMTIAENLSFPLEVRGMGKSEREAKVTRALDMVEMGSFGGRRPSQLSGGQQQRVALARALVFEPELVLMDEPLGALDKQLREKMQFEITHLAHQLGITTVYVTHDQTEALTMSDRVAVFDDGRIQQLAPPDQLYEEPANSFVAQFIGENNTLEGVIKEISDGRALVELDGGEVIDAMPINVSEVGQRTRVSIRPERVEYNKERLQEGVHTLKAEVLEFIYMGDIFRTRLKVAGNDEFIIKTRNAPDQVRLQPGQQIEIGWLPEDCRALDA
ncbi:putative spermidine/putrescine transport system ATP-binding protein [Tritonibacter scottomollicae]|uniref:Spermidine/putrescine import ATP-binding protein PotA n=1 Tax=Tritonibacter scottomollicae TaxID=483013 RepID=A0A2T1AL36_TRISK|nr:putative spermidine/putrescine transport system ATP-binding protein [Tritonibacter scottomollicae]